MLILYIILWVAALYPLHRDGDGATRIRITRQVGIVNTCALARRLYARRTFDGEASPISGAMQILMGELHREGLSAAIPILTSCRQKHHTQQCDEHP